MVVARQLEEDQDRCDRRARHPGEERAHADDRVLLGRVDESREESLHRVAERAAKSRAHHERGSEGTA